MIDWYWILIAAFVAGAVGLFFGAALACGKQADMDSENWRLTVDRDKWKHRAEAVTVEPGVVVAEHVDEQNNPCHTCLKRTIVCGGCERQREIAQAARVPAPTVTDTDQPEGR